MQVPPIHVTEEVCASCPFLEPDNAMLTKIQQDQAVPECVLVAVARLRCEPYQEGVTCCAAYYHKYKDTCYPLQAAQQAGVLDFFSTKGYTSLEESKLAFGTPLYKNSYDAIPAEYNSFYEEVERQR